MLELKLIFAGLAAILMAVSYIPYVRGMFAGRTKPHTYTWLIWFITQGTAIVGLLYGGGGLAAATGLIVAEILVFLVFALSFRYGTKNITRSDTIMLALSFLAILVWWQFENPLVSILIVTAIDLAGYWPTYRKSYEEPWSESLISWGIFSVGNFFSLLALTHYNALTLTYLLAAGLIPNAFLVALCLYRRRFISNPIQL